MEFTDAIAEATNNYRKVHSLLGNGFSRACRDDIFAYGALFDRADFGQLSPSARAAFEALSTRDFEVVISALRRGSQLLQLYDVSAGARERMETDARGLREVLVAAIASSHPNHPNEIGAEQYAACRMFLSKFDRIYTLNYDLLLYWALMHADVGPPLRSDDGFRNPEQSDVDYVVWDPAASNREQRVFYVHGGLHLFDAGAELLKYTWSRTGIRLIDQVRDALAQQRYPLFVAEGTSSQKLERIRHHAYLARIERSFLEVTGALFTYGVSFAVSDNHLLDWMAKGKFSHLYVGLFGDPESESNMILRAHTETLGRRRVGRSVLRISFFNAASARVWG